MPKRTLSISIKVGGVREALAAFRRFPKEASAELRDASGEIAEAIAEAARRGSNIDAQAAAVGKTIKVARDRVPAVQIGGARRVTSTRAPAWALLFGAEFGMTRHSGWYAAPKYADSQGHQFASTHQGREGRFFFPTVEAELPDAIRKWERAVNRAIANWASASGKGSS